jgi:hypothetical protein
VNIDEDGYEMVRKPRPRTLGQYMPEIFAVDAEKPGAIRSCQRKGSAEIVVWRSCATTGAVRNEFGAVRRRSVAWRKWSSKRQRRSERSESDTRLGDNESADRLGNH